MINPFEIINERLSNIESLLLELQRNPNLNSTASEHEKPLVLEAAAAYLDLKPATLYGLVSRREIPFDKKGKRLYFFESQLKSWVASGRKKTISEMASDAVSYLRKGPKKKGAR